MNIPDYVFTPDLNDALLAYTNLLEEMINSGVAKDDVNKRMQIETQLNAVLILIREINKD